MILLIIALFVVVFIIVLQWKSFIATKKNIDHLKTFFPHIDNIGLKECTINKDVLSDRFILRKVAQNPPSKKDDEQMTDKDLNVSLITVTDASPSFKEVVAETNAYLCKNAGTSADLGVLQDICDKKLEVKENAIRSTLNLPLYLGLGGTFIGIIFGVFGFAIDLDSLFGSTTAVGSEKDVVQTVTQAHSPYSSYDVEVTAVPMPVATETPDNTNSLQYLLCGIGFAMIASCFGLGLMVRNSAFNYREATGLLDTKRNEYFDFLRRELMPTLSNSMSSSLNSLKGVLGHFVDKFGKNLDAYADSAQLLNDNLEKQHLVLAEINELGVSRMAYRITSAFTQLKDAADALATFRQYQQELNSTILSVKSGVAEINTLIGKFDDFISSLKSVADAQGSAVALQYQFKAAIEQHFPTGAEGREIWRKEFDTLLQDAQKVSQQLNEQLEQNTSYVRRFVTDNSRFFSGFEEMQSVLAALVEYSRAQSECYRDLRDEIIRLRRDTKDSQRETAELHKSLLEAVKEMTKAVKDSK